MPCKLWCISVDFGVFRFYTDPPRAGPGPGPRPARPGQALRQRRPSQTLRRSRNQPNNFISTSRHTIQQRVVQQRVPAKLL